MFDACDIFDIFSHKNLGWSWSITEIVLWKKIKVRNLCFNIPQNKQKLLQQPFYKVMENVQLFILNKEHPLRGKQLIEGFKVKFSTFGTSHELASDEGSQFRAGEIKKLLKVWGYDQRLTSAYHLLHIVTRNVPLAKNAHGRPNFHGRLPIYIHI